MHNAMVISISSQWKVHLYLIAAGRWWARLQSMSLHSHAITTCIPAVTLAYIHHIETESIPLGELLMPFTVDVVCGCAADVAPGHVGNKFATMTSCGGAMVQCSRHAGMSGGYARQADHQSHSGDMDNISSRILPQAGRVYPHVQTDQVRYPRADGPRQLTPRCGPGFSRRSRIPPGLPQWWNCQGRAQRLLITEGSTEGKVGQGP